MWLILICRPLSCGRQVLKSAAEAGESQIPSPAEAQRRRSGKALCHPSATASPAPSHSFRVEDVEQEAPLCVFPPAGEGLGYAGEGLIREESVESELQGEKGPDAERDGQSEEEPRPAEEAQTQDPEVLNTAPTQPWHHQYPRTDTVNTDTHLTTLTR